MTEAQHSFFWLGLETTGLDEHNGRILEWALALVNDGKGGDMAITQEWSAVIHYPVAELNALPIDDFVRKMHTQNELWHEVEQSTTTLAECDDFLADLCCEVTGRDDATGIMLAGNTVAFDLRWVREHMLKFAKHLSYRVFDVRTLQTAEAEWGDPLDMPKPERHRASEDIRASIAAAAMCRRRRYSK